jgi:hypothetical protein
MHCRCRFPVELDSRLLSNFICHSSFYYRKLGHFNGMQTFLRPGNVQAMSQIVLSSTMGQKLKSSSYLLLSLVASGEAEVLFAGLKVKSGRLNILQCFLLNGRTKRRIRTVRVTGTKLLQLAVESGKVQSI